MHRQSFRPVLVVVLLACAGAAQAGPLRFPVALAKPTPVSTSSTHQEKTLPDERLSQRNVANQLSATLTTSMQDTTTATISGMCTPTC